MIRYGDPHLRPSKNNRVSVILKVITIQRQFTVDDIGLLQTEPVLIESYATLSAIDFSALLGHEVTVIGFGLMRVSPNVYDFNFTLYLVRPLQVMDKSMLRSCDIKRSGKSMLCAVPICRTAQSAYYGDSGGPVIHASGIAGVNTAIIDSLYQRGRDSMKHVVKPNILTVTPVSPYVDLIAKELVTTD